MTTTSNKKPVRKKPVRHEDEVHARSSHTRSGSGHSSSGHSTQGRGSVNHSTGEARNKKKRPPESAKARSKKKRTKILLFIVEIFVLLLMVVVLYGVLKTEKVGKVDIPEEDIVINPEVEQKEETTMKGYRNIALFGVDSTTGALTKNTRSDTIMIASINLDSGECRLVSVYRDTYLNLSNDSYNKCNAAYAKGGPMQAINMLNMNLDLNITDFVTVGFAGLSDTIDALGGVMIDVDDAELQHINNYQLCMAQDLKRDYTPVTSTGYQQLDGLQATAYCRIRYTKGDDFKRAERQREVLMAVADKAKTASPATLNTIANNVFNEIYTSLDISEILELLGEISKYSIVDEGGFPDETYRATGTIGSKGSCVVPVDLTDNVTWLHKFLFQDDAYIPSEEVKSYSEKIKADTSGYISSK